MPANGRRPLVLFQQVLQNLHRVKYQTVAVGLALLPVLLGHAQQGGAVQGPVLLPELGHHGSSNASSYRFLRETNPEAVVISCGYDNSYGHPHRETLERIEDLGAALYRTDTQGTIAVFSDGEHLEFAQEPSVHSDSPAP